MAAIPFPAAVIDGDGAVLIANPDFQSEHGDASAAALIDTPGWRVRTVDCSTRLLTRTTTSTHDLLRRFFASADELFAVYDARGRIVEANAAWQNILGVDPSTLIGADSWGLVADEDLVTRPVVEQQLRQTGRSNPSWRMTHEDGSVRVVHWSLHFDNSVSQCFAIGRDASADERRRDELHRRAYTDPLTGLANRTRIVADLDARLRRNESPAVLFCDLDHFKVINDSLGHAAGDALLTDLAERLSRALGSQGCLAGRFGGDEFAVVVPTGGRDGAVEIAERITELLDTPFTHDRHSIHIAMSIGISVFNASNPQTPDELLAQADLAAYAAKEAGRGGYVVFGDALATRMHRRFTIEAELRAALNDDRIRAWFQPVVRLPDRTVIAAEALVRLEKRNGDIASPAEFLDVAIDAGLMPQIGRAVIEQTLDMAASFGHALELAFNVSAPELYRSEFATWLIDETLRRGLEPHNFWIEVTESVALTNDRAIVILQRLSDAGFRIALDDFGVGQSSLSHLRTLPIDAIKIDRSFVADMLTDPTTQTISRFLVELSETMGLVVIPEGIEQPEQESLLVEFGVSRAQGWLYHRAMPAEALAALPLEQLSVPVGD